MKTKKRSRPPPKAIWAYAYQIVPPQPEDRLHGIKTLLDDANSNAQRGARTWAGRVVSEQQITHILVVSDSPEQNHEVNRKLEAALHELEAGFSITAAMAMDDDSAQSP
jgi:hypothetical protein